MIGLRLRVTDLMILSVCFALGAALNRAIDPDFGRHVLGWAGWMYLSQLPLLLLGPLLFFSRIRRMGIGGLTRGERTWVLLGCSAWGMIGALVLMSPFVANHGSVIGVLPFTGCVLVDLVITIKCLLTISTSLPPDPRIARRHTWGVILVIWHLATWVLLVAALLVPSTAEVDVAPPPAGIVPSPAPR